MRLRTLLGAFACSMAWGAQATVPVTDATDLWIVPQELGYGFNVVQQSDLLFITMFVYGNDSQATWFHAPSVQYQYTFGGVAYYQGDLFETRGQFFGGDFQSYNVRIRQVGTVTFALEAPNQATITYSIDQYTLTKHVARSTFRRNFFPGLYLGASAGTFSGCTPASRNGYVERSANVQLVEQDPRTVHIKLDDAGGNCDYSGLYGQAGRLGYVSGFFSCTDGRAGTFDITELQPSAEGFTAKMQSKSSGCQYDGRFGGVRSDRAP